MCPPPLSAYDVEEEDDQDTSSSSAPSIALALAQQVAPSIEADYGQRRGSNGAEGSSNSKRRRITQGLGHHNALTPPSTGAAHGGQSSVRRSSRRTRAVAPLYDSRLHPIDKHCRPSNYRKRRPQSPLDPSGSDDDGVYDLQEPDISEDDESNFATHGRRSTREPSTPPQRLPEPKAIRRSERAAGQIYPEYRSNRHPQDYDIGWPRRRNRGAEPDKSLASKQGSKPKGRLRSIVDHDDNSTAAFEDDTMVLPRDNSTAALEDDTMVGLEDNAVRALDDNNLVVPEDTSVDALNDNNLVVPQDKSVDALDANSMVILDDNPMDTPDDNPMVTRDGEPVVISDDRSESEEIPDSEDERWSSQPARLVDGRETTPMDDFDRLNAEYGITNTVYNGAQQQQQPNNVPATYSGRQNFREWPSPGIEGYVRGPAPDQQTVFPDDLHRFQFSSMEAHTPGQVMAADTAQSTTEHDLHLPHLSEEILGPNAAVSTATTFSATLPRQTQQVMRDFIRQTQLDGSSSRPSSRNSARATTEQAGALLFTATQATQSSENAEIRNETSQASGFPPSRTPTLSPSPSNASSPTPPLNRSTQDSPSRHLKPMADDSDADEYVDAPTVMQHDPPTSSGSSIEVPTERFSSPEL